MKLLFEATAFQKTKSNSPLPGQKALRTRSRKELKIRMSGMPARRAEIHPGGLQECVAIRDNTLMSF
ncbi:MAG: hypothetical protein HON76_12425 [Candidatus Scalindua sp.]|nr:hypothetical protein [Candidatus Scalindua sp.]MBT5307396.1 hypothetical protein [Candidatus Scalindua sp.]MBT6050448.1 hypothetical protein [Candidatus Scalindua sp.]MBT6225275.1 hypothetical protein [Candidatus Scalindua sp.]MBT6563318.1 hypothetical protein [Candidatus Scalindua sp.]